MVTIIGLLAGLLTTLSWVPQLYKTFRTRRAEDFSWGWLLLFGIGVSGWLAYGIGAGQAAVIVANGVTLLIVVSLASFKFLTKQPRTASD